MNAAVKELLPMLMCIRRFILLCCRPLLGNHTITHKRSTKADGWCEQMEAGDLAPFEYGVDLEVTSTAAEVRSISVCGDHVSELSIDNEASKARRCSRNSENLIDLSSLSMRDPHQGLSSKITPLRSSLASKSRSHRLTAMSKITEPRSEMRSSGKSSSASTRVPSSPDGPRRRSRDLNVRFPESEPPPTGFQMLQSRLAGFIKSTPSSPEAQGLPLVEVIEYDRPSSSVDPFTPLWKRRQRDGFFDESDSEASPASSVGSPRVEEAHAGVRNVGSLKSDRSAPLTILADSTRIT